MDMSNEDPRRPVAQPDCREVLDITQHPGDELIGQRVKIKNPGYWADGRVVRVLSVFTVHETKCFSFRATYKDEPEDHYGLPVSMIETIIRKQ